MTAIVQAVVGFIAWLSGFVGRRLALTATFVTLISTFYATMVLVVSGATAAVALSIPTWLTQALAMFLPSDTGAAMAVVMTARVARWVYDVSIKVAAVVILLH